MRTDITVTNRNKKHGLNEKFIKAAAVKVFKIIRKSPGTKLEIVFLSDADIKPVNKKYKHSDRTTDVLSFDLGDAGSIAISLDTASRNAKTFGTLFHEEALRYVVHGILHLFGYDDGTGPDRRKMAAEEDRILRHLCSNTVLSKVLTRR